MSAKNPQPGDICQIKKTIDLLKNDIEKNTIGYLSSKGFLANTYFIKGKGEDKNIYLLHRSDFTIKRIKKLKPNKPFKYVDKEVI